MCGRLACTLEGCHFRKACTYRNSAGVLELPKYGYVQNEGSGYSPSYNVAPTCTTPVVISAKVKLSGLDVPGKESENVERQLCNMRWGISPSWDSSKNINNVRSESVMEKSFFKKPFTTGQRCVVAANGFYEWKKLNGGKLKQPYFIYESSNMEWQSLIGIEDLDQFWSATKGWTGPKLLNMAGIFYPYSSSNPLDPPYSYSVLTIESSEPFSSIHNRVPVMLESEEEIQTWLCTKSPTEAILPLLKPPSNLEWYTVSTNVNNSRFKESSCIVKTKPIPNTPQKKSVPILPGQRSIKSFFQSSTPSNSGISKNPPKKAKIEF